MTDTSQNKTNLNGVSALFFGRKNDANSERCAKHLENLGFKVTVVWSSKRDDKLPQYIFDLSFDYIFCYRSFYVLPKSLLDKANLHSINFHPGTPKYPGSGGINFAIYNEDKRFGITVHLMNEKIDNGKIIDVTYFPIVESDNLESLLQKTHECLFSSFINFSTKVRESGSQYIKEMTEKNTNLTWHNVKRTIKEVDDYQTVYTDIEPKELERRIRAFNNSSYPITLKFHGKKFIFDPSNDD